LASWRALSSTRVEGRMVPSRCRCSSAFGSLRMKHSISDIFTVYRVGRAFSAPRVLVQPGARCGKVLGHSCWPGGAFQQTQGTSRFLPWRLDCRRCRDIPLCRQGAGGIGMAQPGDGCDQKQALRSERASYTTPRVDRLRVGLKTSLARADTSGAKDKLRGEVISVRIIGPVLREYDDCGPNAAWRTPTDAGCRGSKCTGR
jgi:hypothetical protein